MNTQELLSAMEHIARHVITSVFITDFTEHDVKAISKCNAWEPFIWQIRNTGTWLYFLSENDWKKRLSERMDVYRQNRTDNLYYIYDGNEFFPCLESKVYEMSQNQGI